MDSADPTIEIMVTLRHEQDGSQRADLRLHQPASPVDYDLAVARPVQLDYVALRALLLDPVSYGRTLAAQLFADDDLRDAWARAASVAAVSKLPMRLRLDLDPRDEELHCVIWELLTPPGGGQALALSEYVRLSRYLGTANLATGVHQASAAPHALIIVANPTDLGDFGLAPVDSAGEVRRIQTALGPIPATILATGGDEPATLDQIRTAMRTGPTLCYLVCHGSFVADEPYLWLERDDGQAERVSGTAFIAMLENLAIYPRLIILGSCRSGGDGARVLPALAPRLVQAGVPAVIGAQGDLSMAAVEAALPELIAELRHDGRVDRALAAARAVLRGQSDWWRLTLWMHLRDGRIWPVPASDPAITALTTPLDRSFVCRHLRLSFLWAETYERPQRTAAEAVTLDLGSEANYSATFATLAKEGTITFPDGTALELPWHPSRRQNFWRCYLEQQPLSSISGRTAYRQLVPLRVRLPWQLAVVGFSGDAEIEGFCTPYGSACVVTIRCTDDLGLAEALMLAPLVRRAPLLSVQTPDGFLACTLEDLADRALDHLASLGSDRAARRRTDLHPFSIATIVRGAGVHPALPFAEDSAAHHLLETLTRWQAPVAGVRPTRLIEARIATDSTNAQAGDLLYGHQRARAIWLPRHFTNLNPSSALGCYHRNLVFAALQVESMGGLIRQAAARLESGQRLSGVSRSWAQRAYGALSRLHSGSELHTYRSMSSRHQLADNALLAPLNRVRQEFGQLPLEESRA
ncbi:MAG: CHAT domain-containing protein [Oscillochloridaceae bacterium umkhey_bin13]